jgi:hypothetical protein
MLRPTVPAMPEKDVSRAPQSFNVGYDVPLKRTPLRTNVSLSTKSRSGSLKGSG